MAIDSSKLGTLHARVIFRVFMTGLQGTVRELDYVDHDMYVAPEIYSNTTSLLPWPLNQP